MNAVVRVMALWREAMPALLLGLVAALLSISAVAALALLAGAAPWGGRAIVAGAVLLFALRGLGVARVVLRWTERMLTHSATFRAQTAVRVWLFRRLSGRSAGGLGLTRRGDALARLVGDVETLDGLYLRILIPMAALLLLVVVLASALAEAAIQVAVPVCLLLGVAGLVVPWLVARGTWEDGGQLAEAASGLRVATVDALSGLREVRAFGNEGRMLAAVQSREAALFAAQRRVARHAALGQAAAVLCSQAALLLVVLGGLPVAAVLPCLLLTIAAFEAAAAMPRAGALAGHAAAAAGRVTATADAPSDAPADPVDPVPVPGGHGLRFDQVQFAWPGRAPVFVSLDLDIPAGNRVAVLGPSGAGKSTLAALALKVVAPQGGRVLLGGTDVARLRAADVRGRIAWLSQATHVFSDTVRDNLRLGRPDADDAALWAALDQAGLSDTVRGLPQGLDSWIGAGGTGLSGGELRRVALARALLSPAPILILDEPVTGLDDAAARAFFLTLNAAAEGRTVVLIVHRLLGVERLDRIWRLSGGRAVAATG